MIKPITLFQHFPWNVHLIRNDHRKLRLRLSLSLTIDWNMIVCSRTTAIVASEMCIEYRTIYNSIGRVWEIPDTGITDCQAVDIRSHPVYHLSTWELDLYVNYFASSDILGIPGLSVYTLLSAKMPQMLFLGCDPSHVFTHITTVYTLTQPDTSAPVFTFISKTDFLLESL